MIFGQDPWDVYAEGLKRCLGSIRIRELLLQALRAEWGGKGDFQAMRAFLTRPEIRSLPEAQLKRLTALELTHEAHYQQYFEKDQGEADRLYLESLAVMPTLPALCYMIDRPGTNMAKAEDYARQALELDPSNNSVRTTLGVWHAVHGRSSRGLKLLKETRTWGDPVATDFFRFRSPVAQLFVYGRLIIRLGF